MNKNLFFIGLLLLLFISCNEVEPEIKEDPTVFQYVYSGEHFIEDFNVYVGPKGEKTQMSENNATLFWGEHSLLGQPWYDTLIINTNIDTIFFKDEWHTISLPMKISGDTVKNNKSSFEYFGKITNDSTFILNRAFYYIHHEGRTDGHSSYSENGHVGYWRYYEKARFNEFFHENSSFGSLSDMNRSSDTIAYLTEYYIFKLNKAY